MSYQPNSNSAVQFGGLPSSTGPFNVLPNSSALTSTKVLIASIASSTAGNYLAFYHKGVQYQVGASKTFVAHGMWMFSATADVTVSIGTATASFSNNAASVTGAVYYTGAVGNPLMASPTSSSSYWYYPIPIQFDATLYPWASPSGNTQSYCVIIMGQEY